MKKTFFDKTFCLSCILYLLGACAPTSINESGRLPVTYLSETEDPSVLGQLQVSLDEAELLENPNPTMLKIAILFAKNGSLKRSKDTLARINPDLLNDQTFIEYSLLKIELSLNSNGFEEAQVMINHPRFGSLESLMNRKNKQRVLSFKADIKNELGHPIEGIRDLTELAQIIEKRSDILKIHNRIWRELTSQPLNQISNCAKDKDFDLREWCNLAYKMRNFQNNRDDQVTFFSEWRVGTSIHPASQVPPSWFVDLEKKLLPFAQIAILLPMQDDYRDPSQTFLDGFLDSYYELYENNNSQLPEIRIYDTSTQTIQKAYVDAALAGADIIIGGIRESEAASLNDLTILSLPTIILNGIDNLENRNLQNLFQFNNAQDDEIIQLGSRIQRRGFKRAIVIFPDQIWGYQAAKNFSDYWTKNGGTIVNQISYSETTKDFTQHLKSPLNIDLSEERGINIKRFINSQVILSSRRRQDVDFTVIFGYPEKVRQIKPALDFLYAADLPVYASSKIYNGVHQDDLNRDLSDIVFTAMPWTLPKQLPRRLKSNVEMHIAYKQLYARGYDSFSLLRNLKMLKLSPEYTVFGATGLLSLDEGIVKRRLQWANFQNGKVIVLP
jgi:outer membrane PBP1 activator LpoA protein